MAVLLSKGALALFAFTAFAPSATGSLAASASDIEIESERQHRLRGQEVKDSIQVDSVRRLQYERECTGTDPRNQKMLEVNSDEPLDLLLFDICEQRDVATFIGIYSPTHFFKCVPEGRYLIILHAGAFYDLVSELNIEY